MKKLFGMLLVAVLVLGFAACGNGTADKPVINEPETLTEAEDTSSQVEEPVAEEELAPGAEEPTLPRRKTNPAMRPKTIQMLYTM